MCHIIFGSNYLILKTTKYCGITLFMKYNFFKNIDVKIGLKI